jgi:hypothetical protein
VFVAILISVITGAGFSDSDFICLIVIVLYMVDVSNSSIQENNKFDGAENVMLSDS